MAENIVDMREVMNQVTIKMTIRLQHEREMKWRAWLGRKLIVLAARVMGCRIEVKMFEDTEHMPPVHFNERCELIRDEKIV